MEPRSLSYTLPISPRYVEHWGFWEATRELLQNALDERDRGEGVMSLSHCAGVMLVCTTSGHLDVRTLVLGETGKSAGDRGKFGEGYKLAAMVLCRLGHEVQCCNGPDDWTFRIERDPHWGTEVLRVDVDPGVGGDRTGVEWQIRGVSREQFDEIRRNMRSHDEGDKILLEPEEAGRLYVGGLFVRKVEGFVHGYSLSPSTLQLDRDRQMVSDFDLSYATSRLWARDPSGESVRLLGAKAPDVAHVQVHAGAASPVVAMLASDFGARHGDAVPVSTQEEIEQVQQAGLRWALVPQVVQNILRLVRSWVVPSTVSPADRLRSWERRYCAWLNDAARRELGEIIESLEARSEA